jgi:hypothetical protein
MCQIVETWAQVWDTNNKQTSSYRKYLCRYVYILPAHISRSFLLNKAVKIFVQSNILVVRVEFVGTDIAVGERKDFTTRDEFP